MKDGETSDKRREGEVTCSETSNRVYGSNKATRLDRMKNINRLFEPLCHQPYMQ